MRDNGERGARRRSDERSENQCLLERSENECLVERSENAPQAATSEASMSSEVVVGRPRISRAPREGATGIRSSSAPKGGRA